MSHDRQAILAQYKKTFLSNAVEQPDNFDSDFLTPMMRYNHLGLVETMHGAFKNLCTQKASAAGFALTPTAATLRERFTALTEDQLEDLTEELGSGQTAGTIRVRTGGKGLTAPKGGQFYVVSLPVVPMGFIFARSSLPKNGLQDPAGLGDSLYRKHANYFKALVGKTAAAEILEPTKAFDVLIPDIAAAITDGPYFKGSIVSDNDPFLLTCIKKYVVGFRIMSPPITTDQRYSYNAQQKNPEQRQPELPREEDASNKDEHFSEILNLRQFQVFFELKVPHEFASYMTQTDAKSVKLGDLSIWFNMWMMSAIGGNAIDSPDAISSISSIKKRNKDSNENKGRIVNDISMSITKEGLPYYLPTIDQVDEYEDEFQKAGECPDGDYSLRDVTRLPDNKYTFGEKREDKIANKKTYPTNRPIFTDFTNYRFSYSTPEGLVGTVNLDDWQALTAVHVANILRKPLYEENVFTKYLMDELTYVFSKRFQQAGLVPMKFFDEDQSLQAFSSGYVSILRTAVANYDIRAFLSAYKNAYMSILQSDEFAKYPDMPATLEDLQLVDFYAGRAPGLGWVGRILVELCEKIYDKEEAIVEYAQLRSVPNALREMGLVICLGKYGPLQEKVFKVDLEKRDVYVNPKLEEDHQPADIPHVQDGRFIFPHQNKVDNYLSNNESAKYIILACDAGGGKTSMVLRDAMMRLSKGTIRRPLILCPDKLIPNYIAEAVYFYGGGLNMIPITTKTLADYGEDRLLEMMENAPPNTIVLSSYQFLAGRPESVYYGNAKLTLYMNSELVRTWGGDIVYNDEAHDLRNDSQRTKATRRVCYDIPTRCIASGTLVNNQLSDLANEMSIFDPSLFGNKSAFMEEYALDYVGNTVRMWKPGAEGKLKAKIAGQALLITCRRKEWAALLPEKDENLHIQEVNKDGAWYKAYDAILRETIENIKKDKELVEALDEEDEASEGEEALIEADLRPYLQRLEMFLSAPEKDIAAKELGVDNIRGPKVKMLNTILKDHFDTLQDKGKVLIFTSYHNSADSLYENMEPKFKKMCIRYHSDTGERDIAEFQKNPAMRILVGTEGTLNTGHNFQMASRLVRIESIWTPGNLQQSEARVYRPDPKMLAGGKRNTVYLDWIVVDNTIDVTKMSRLISKILTKARFDEDSAAFEELPELPPVVMTIDNLIEHNSFEHSLRPYAEAYGLYQRLQREDLEAYRDDPKNKVVPIVIKASKFGVPGEALMKNLPYAETAPIPYAKELNLMPMAEYISEYGKGQTTEEFDCTDLPVHTEWGDGTVTSSQKKRIRIELTNGSKLSVNKLATFVRMDMLKGGKSSGNIRKKIAEISGLKLINMDGTPSVVKDKVEKITKNGKQPAAPVVDLKKLKKVNPAAETGEQTPLALEAVALYQMVGIEVSNTEDLDKADKDRLVKLGFRSAGPYVICHFTNRMQYDKFLEKLENSAYQVGPAYMKVLKKLQESFEKSGKSRLFQAHRALAIDMKNFWRLQIMPSKPKELKPYPVVMDGELSVAFRLDKQPAAKTVRQQLKVPGVEWDLIEEELLFLASTKAEAQKKVDLLDKHGFTVTKPKTFKKSLDSLIITKPKKDKA